MYKNNLRFEISRLGKKIHPRRDQRIDSAFEYDPVLVPFTEPAAIMQTSGLNAQIYEK